MLNLVVARTGAALQRSGVLTAPLAFYPEQLPAIRNMLLEAKNSPHKFPAVMCLMDMPEKETLFAGRPKYRTARAHFLLVSPTSPNPAMSVQDREEQVYKPVLYPMYAEFIASFRLVPGISIVSQEIDRINRYRMTASFNEAAQSQGLERLFNADLDGIEIRNLSLKTELAECHKYLIDN
jgi:hypothetical protein